MEHTGFLRRKSPVVGIVFSAILAFLLFCILLTGFVFKSATSVLNNMSTTVTTLLEDKTFRTQIAKTIQSYAPEDSLTVGEITQLMSDEEIAGTVGELSAIWFDDIMENDADPSEAIIEALKNPEMADAYSKSLEKSMEKLDKDSADLLDAAQKLAEEHGFEPPAEGSSDLEIAIAVLEGSREKLDTEIEEVASYVVTTKKVIKNVSFALPVFTTLLFVLLNILLVAIFYGLFLLLTRHLLKPCLYLGVPYLLVGAILLVLQAINLASIVSVFVEIPKEFRFVFDVILDPLFLHGLIAVIIGGVFVAGSVTGLVLMALLRKKPQAVPAGTTDLVADKIDDADVAETPEEAPVAEEPSLEKAAVDAAPQVTVCPNCGEPLEGTVFCTNCGTRLDQ